MATARSIPAGVIREIEREHSSQNFLVFAEFYNDEIATPIRVVSDPVDHVYGGDTYTGFQFNITILSDTDRPPEAQVQIQNVDRVVGSALRDVTEPIRANLTVIAGTEFNQAVDPRTEIGTAAIIYQASELYLVDVEVTALTVTGILRLWDYTQEQWPSVMATQDRFPGLFR